MEAVVRESSSRKASRGSTMVEMALVIPVFVLILFGILQWGFIFSAKLILNNAVAVGVRNVVLYQGTEMAGENATMNALSPLDPGPAVVDCVEGATATCSLTYDYPLFFAAAVPGSTGGILTLQASAVMR